MHGPLAQIAPAWRDIIRVGAARAIASRPVTVRRARRWVMAGIIIIMRVIAIARTIAAPGKKSAIAIAQMAVAIKPVTGDKSAIRIPCTVSPEPRGYRERSITSTHRMPGIGTIKTCGGLLLTRGLTAARILRAFIGLTIAITGTDLIITGAKCLLIAKARAAT